MGYSLGLVSVSFRGHSPKEILGAMQDAGLCCIEWGSDVHVPPEKAEEIASLQKQYGIRCCSYGTYFRLGITPIEELPRYIAAAKILGTDILRLWCGDRCSDDYNDDERDRLFDECRKAAKIAEENGVILCMECHQSTYTQTLSGAKALMEAVNADAFRMYWQPNQFKTVEENIEYAECMAKYTCHLHVFQWREDGRFPLEEGVEEWRGYLQYFRKDSTLLLEFMPDDNIHSLKRESDALRTIIKP